jgi:hypothetical protein
MSTNGRHLQALLLLLTCVGACAAKSPLARIEISRGADLVASIEGETAREFTIWSGPGTSVTADGVTAMSLTPGDIADWKLGAVAPPENAAALTVAFHCEACEPARTGAWRCYGVRYLPGANGAPGLIQIPAAGDREFPGNLQTIYRGVEGRWFRASEKWERLVGSRVAAAPAS